MKTEKFVNINWYLERKPYHTYTDYDLFYLKICRDLFALIEKLTSRHQDQVDLQAEDCRELAYTFTAYFEDQVNGIGFWQSLTTLHRQHFGKRLPFFDAGELTRNEEEYEDILPADLHYLAFIHYINLHTAEDQKTLVYFHKSFFIELAEQVFDYLDRIEEVPTTEEYEQLLVPPEDYIAFKQLADWFTFESYLTGYEFSSRHIEYLLLLTEKQTDSSLVPPLMYEERDRLMFNVPSSLTAFFPADLLAGALRCSDEKKEEVRNLKWRLHGVFQVKKETPTHYHFLHTSTGEQYDVLKSSLNQPIDSGKEKFWVTTLAAWNGDYYISGMCLPFHGLDLEEYNFKNQHSCQVHSKAYRDQLHQTALNYRTHAAQFFGNDLVVFDTGRELQKQLDAFSRWYFDTATIKSRLPTDAKPQMIPLPPDVLAEKDITLYLPPADGLQFIFDHKKLLHVLQTPDTGKITRDEIEEVVPLLLDENVDADYWFYLKQHFPLPNLSLFLKCPAESDEDFTACLRIYKPDEFSPRKLPGFTVVDSGQSKPGIIKQLFSKKKKE